MKILKKSQGFSFLFTELKSNSQFNSYKFASAHTVYAVGYIYKNNLNGLILSNCNL